MKSNSQEGHFNNLGKDFPFLISSSTKGLNKE